MTVYVVRVRTVAIGNGARVAIRERNYEVCDEATALEDIASRYEEDHPDDRGSVFEIEILA